MIKINITNEKEIKNVVIKGHSGYGVVGTDIICSSVSSIAITTINAIIRINSQSITYEMKDGLIKINNISNDEITQKLLINMIELLKELEQQYPKNLKIDGGANHA